jgi:predicted amidophosphoribosyltransferase
MVVVKPLKKCPYCREPIAAEATRCKHCQADLTDKPKSRSGRWREYDNFRVGFLTGVLFSILLALLILANIRWGI